MSSAATLATLVVAGALLQPVVDDGPATVRSPSGAVRGDDDPVLGRTFRLGPTEEPTTERPTPTPTPPDLRGEVRFCLACDELDEAATRVVTDLAARVPPGTCLAVEGHADTTDDEDLNLALSLRRALAVATVLDTPSVEVSVRWFGEERPQGGPDEADRRVEIFAEPCSADLTTGARQAPR